MAQGMWCTKEDVLKDLEMASGRQLIDVDDGFVVVGEQPPPPRVIDDDDDEIELLFGPRRKSGNLSQGEIKPDLQGITQMLRMVQDYEHSSDEEVQTVPGKPKSKNDIIVISKLNPTVKEFFPLNPNVKEFIPKCAGNESSPEKSNVNNASSIVSKSSGRCNVDLFLENNNVKIENTTCDSGTKEDSKEATKQMAAMLRSKILVKPETYEEKREAHSAIVNLLKLYAKPRPKPLKLLTPDFFENSKASECKTTEECSARNSTRMSTTTDLIENKVSTQKYTKPEILENRNDIDSGISHIEFDKTDETSLTPNMAESRISDERVPSVTLEKPVDPNMAESINKVNKWFDYKPTDRKEKPKSPSLYLGTVSYKRKDPVTCKSPSDVDKKISKSSNGSYKPSRYAEELLQKYNRKKEIATPVRQLNIWEKLEEDLKKKDEEIRYREKEAKS